MESLTSLLAHRRPLLPPHRATARLGCGNGNGCRAARRRIGPASARGGGGDGDGLGQRRQQEEQQPGLPRHRASRLSEDGSLHSYDISGSLQHWARDTVEPHLTSLDPAVWQPQPAQGPVWRQKLDSFSAWLQYTYL